MLTSSLHGHHLACVSAFYCKCSRKHKPGSRPVRVASSLDISAQAKLDNPRKGLNATRQTGRAWLVGCGPGDPELLTLKAVKLIQAADVIMYDDLGTEEAVSKYGSSTAIKLYVGKRGGKQSIKQPEIDQLLVRYCLQGKQVVRLKGGCPSVFSRCSSELTALRNAHVPVELVPGVSSALAAPLLAGFPLTDARVGRSFAVTSAHNPDAVDWASLAGVDTLVLLMAGSHVDIVAERMQESGWKPGTPVAIVRAAGLPEQTEWLSDLGSTAEAVKDAGSLSPCVMIVGNVVSLGHR